MGVPNPDLQKEFDATNKRIAAKRASFWGNTSPVKPVDKSKLTEAGRQLRERVGSPQPIKPAVSQVDHILAQIRSMGRSQRIQLLNYEDARLIVDTIYQQELKNRNRVPIWTEQNLAVIDDVTRYFIGDPTGPLPLTKGLFVYGPVGVGKTYLFRMMSLLCQFTPIREMKFRMVSTKRIMRRINDEKSLKPLHTVEQGAWLIDDLGEEKKLTKVYGDIENPIDHLISSRSESYIDSGQLTHFTSNKQPDELESIYGTRAFDRLSEMVEPIFFDGVSLRNPDEEHEEV